MHSTPAPRSSLLSTNNMSCNSLIFLAVLFVQVLSVTINAQNTNVPKGGLNNLYEYVEEQINKIEADMDILRTQNANMQLELEAEIDLLKTQNANMQLELDEVKTELQIMGNKTNVAVHVRASTGGGPYSSGDIVKFTKLQTSVGLDNINDFISTGKFNCSFPGIYLMSFTILSDTDDANFRVYKNNDQLNGLFIGRLANSYGTVSGVFVVDLEAGDTVYVKCGRDQFVYGDSFRAIVKID